jgi:general control protein GCN4
MAPDMCPSGVSPSRPSGNAETHRNSDIKRHIAGEPLSSTILTNMPVIMESVLDDTAPLAQDTSRDMDVCAHEFLSELRIRQHSLLISPESPLLLDHSLSAPSSIALTTLTSPSLSDESPMFASSCQVSPQFDGIDYNASEWFSLFPVEPIETMHMNRLDCTAGEEAGLNADNLGQRARDSPPAPHEQARRHSHSSGVNRRRTKPLPPIIVEDHNDHVAMKRARNTIAARKSRQRKAQRVEDLENEILRLTAERDHWRQLAESRDS